MGGGTADIDADGAQLDIVLAPDEAGQFLAVGFGGVFVLKIQFVHNPSAWDECGRPAALVPLACVGNRARAVEANLRHSAACRWRGGRYPVIFGVTPLPAIASSHSLWMRGPCPSNGIVALPAA